MFDNLVLGAVTAFSVHNLLYAFIGVLLGNIIGVLPGIGALAAISMLLPATYGLDPIGALLMLAGLYYGTSFGGATTSILLNLPGTPSHAIVCVEGNPLARQGKGGLAIFMAMLSSFIGVVVGILVMTFFSPLLTDLALVFGPAEYFSLMLLGLIAASTLTTSSPLKGIISVIMGLLLGVIGIDVNSGLARLNFGFHELQDGISLVALAMGLFGISDVLAHAGHLGDGAIIANGNVGGRNMRPDWKILKQSGGSIGRGSIIGSVLGILPGAGGSMASFMSYAVEKRVSRTPQRYGTGMMQGVSGPEAANSSAAITAFIPTLTLGIPGDAIMALMLGALMIHNITPGPLLMNEHPELFWGLLASFGIGNLMLLILNIPLIKVWVKLLSVPYRLTFPVILFLIAIGVYSANNNLFDVSIVLIIGVFGYLAVSLGYQPAPLLLGFVLGPMLEENFRRALVLSRGDLTVFFTETISGWIMAFTILILLVVGIKQVRRIKLSR